MRKKLYGPASLLCNLAPGTKPYSMIGTTGHRGSQKQEALESPEVGIRQIFTLCWAQNQELYNSNTYNILDDIRQVAQLCSVQNPAKVSCIGMSWAGMGLDGVGYEHLLRKRTFAGISHFLRF